jgi:hypothetical protein
MKRDKKKILVNCQEDKKNLKFRSCLAGKPNSVKEEFKEKNQ